MTLNVDAVIEISRAVAREHHPRFEVLGVASTHGGSNRIELLVSSNDAGVLMINVARAEPYRLREDIRQALQDATVAHRRV